MTSHFPSGPKPRPAASFSFALMVADRWESLPEVGVENSATQRLPWGFSARHQLLADDGIIGL